MPIVHAKNWGLIGPAIGRKNHMDDLGEWNMHSKIHLFGSHGQHHPQERSPAQDYISATIDLNETLREHPAATF